MMLASAAPVFVSFFRDTAMIFSCARSTGRKRDGDIPVPRELAQEIRAGICPAEMPHPEVAFRNGTRFRPLTEPEKGRFHVNKGRGPKSRTGGNGWSSLFRSRDLVRRNRSVHCRKAVSVSRDGPARRHHCRQDNLIRHCSVGVLNGASARPAEHRSGGRVPAEGSHANVCTRGRSVRPNMVFPFSRGTP